MKKIFAFVLYLILLQQINAQQQYADSLQKVIEVAKEDSSKAFALFNLSYYYSLLYPDSAIYYSGKLDEFSSQHNYLPAKALGLIAKAEALDRTASYPEALESAFAGLEIAKKLKEHNLLITGLAYDIIYHLNSITDNQKEALIYLNNAADYLNRSGEHTEYFYNTFFQRAYSTMMQGKNDSALLYIRKGKAFFEEVKKMKNPTPWLITGNVYRFSGRNIDSAENYFRQGIKLSGQYNSVFMTAVLYNALADVLYEKRKMDSCFYYAKKSLELSQRYKYKLFEVNASGFLAYIYDTINADSAYKYIKIMVFAKDEVMNVEKGRQFQKAAAAAEKREKEEYDTRIRFQNRVKIVSLIFALAVFALVAILFWRNNRLKKKANYLLTQQKQQLEKTLTELESTQQQLIQSEKMASLGELTAGIAHEIQNPLNFVNNFSEVNKELADELEQEIDKGNYTDAKTIAKDIKDNEQKINYHGKRADAIVKNMLQHSRSSSGKKEPTDINALADEYLRLAYHGLRAKDKSFNATMKIDFDESIGKINIVPQDIGRVILNLINNAFYTVDEKKKQTGDGYEPIVTVSTKLIIPPSGGQRGAEIKVADNGNGIPQKVVDKVFQPFFTTKPTGQGTGLGLSLSYDIVKAHGGELKVETKEGEGTSLIIILKS